MAQHFNNFDGYTVGVQPSDWTRLWTQNEPFLVEDNGGDLQLSWGATDIGYDLLAWDQAPSTNNYEILTRNFVGERAGYGGAFGLPAELVNHGVGVLASSAGGYYIAHRGNINRIDLVRYSPTGTAETSVAQAAAPNTYNAWVWLRVRVGTDGRIRVRVWLDGETEPSTWQIDATDGVFTSGRAGLFGRNARANDSYWSHYGVGTNGDTAPSAPVEIQEVTSATETSTPALAQNHKLTPASASSLTEVSRPVLPTFNLEWREAGSQTATLVTGLTSQFYSLSGLEASNSYEFRVQESDGITDSEWSAWSPFTTTAGSVTINGESFVVSDNSSSTGVAERTVEGSQDAPSGPSSSTGAGTRKISGEAVHQSQEASHFASSSADANIGGSSDAQAQASQASGVAEREVKASSEAYSGQSTSTASGNRTVKAVSDVVSGDSSVSGSVEREITANAAHNAQNSSHTATSSSLLTVTGESAAASAAALASGVGERELQGSSACASDSAVQQAQGSRDVTSESVASSRPASSEATAQVVRTGVSFAEASAATCSAIAKVSQNITGESDVQAQSAQHFSTSRPVFVGSLSKTSVSIYQDRYSLLPINKDYSLEIL